MYVHIHYTYMYNITPKQTINSFAHHIRQVEVLCFDGVWVDPESHDVGHGGIEEPPLRGGQDGYKHMRPRKREEESSGTVGTQHQTLVICTSEVNSN